MEFKDYYALLGVSPSASEKEIKQAFRRLAHKFHPDKQGENDFSQSHYLACSQAYQVLSNPASRKLYDREFRLQGKSLTETVYSPEQILIELQTMNSKLSRLSLQQIDLEGTFSFLSKFMSGPKAAFLLRSSEPDWIKYCLEQVVEILAVLPDRYVLELYPEMGLLMQTNPEFKASVEKLYKKARKNRTIQKLYPYIVLVITVLVCLGMYYFKEW